MRHSLCLGTEMKETSLWSGPQGSCFREGKQAWGMRCPYFPNHGSCSGISPREVFKPSCGLAILVNENTFKNQICGLERSC